MSSFSSEQQQELARLVGQGTDRYGTLIRQLQGRAPSEVTALPSGPSDGQRVVYRFGTDQAWDLLYDADASGSYKWLVLGGSDLYSESTGTTSTASTTAPASVAAGPSVTVPLAGEYHVSMFAEVSNSNAGGAAVLGLNVNGANSEALRAIGYSIAAANVTACSAHGKVTVTSASTTVDLRFRAGGSGGTASLTTSRSLCLRPQRVG